MLREPGTVPSSTSPGLRTSTVTTSRTEAIRSAKESKVRREDCSITSWRRRKLASGDSSAPTTVSNPIRARRIVASRLVSSSPMSTIGVPGLTTWPTYSAKRPLSPTLIDPRTWPSAKSAPSRVSMTTAPSSIRARSSSIVSEATVTSFGSKSCASLLRLAANMKYIGAAL